MRNWIKRRHRRVRGGGREGNGAQEMRKIDQLVDLEKSI